jgi:hypothetical protein
MKLSIDALDLYVLSISNVWGRYYQIKDIILLAENLHQASRNYCCFPHITAVLCTCMIAASFFFLVKIDFAGYCRPTTGYFCAQYLEVVKQILKEKNVGRF